jgi:hypothetical protein
VCEREREREREREEARKPVHHRNHTHALSPPFSQEGLSESFDVFLSYAWVNSGSAVADGDARLKEGALGHGDPRLMKRHLEEAGFRVWLDVEQVGRVGAGCFREVGRWGGQFLFWVWGLFHKGLAAPFSSTFHTILLIGEILPPKRPSGDFF